MVANRNARRRAQYAKQNQQPKQTPAHALFTTTFQARSGEHLYNNSPETITHPDLGITTRTHGGHLVDLTYFSRTEVSGVINHTNLNEESYKVFGFTDPSMKNYANYMPNSVSELSRTELSLCSPEEKSGFRFFTGEQYQWVNDALYQKNGIPAGDERTHTKYFEGEVLDEKFNRHYMMPMNRNAMRLKEVTDTIDSGLKKAPHKSRIVYRGAHIRHGSFNGQTADSWISENVSLGQEMVLDGYHSTSMSESIAADYAGEGGVMYEILTPEGVNITSISKYEDETEVILPRKSRYMVVGIHRQAHSKSVEDNTIRELSVIQLVAIDEKGAVLNSENHHTVAGLTNDDLSIAS